VSKNRKPDQGGVRVQRFRSACATAVGLAVAVTPAFAEAPPAAGEVIQYGELRRLRPVLPRELWRFRDLLFFDGMALRVRERTDQSPPLVYRDATRRHSGARIAVDGSLAGYVAGQPFPMRAIDCEGDPQAGVKIAWNFDHQWEGAGSSAHFRVTFVHRGRVQEGGLEGRLSTVLLANRVEPYYLDRDAGSGSVLPGDPRKLVNQIDLTAPASARRSWTAFTRYRSSEGPLATARLDELWQFSPSVGRVTRSEVEHRSTPVEGAEVVPDDLGSFAGVVTHYAWECKGEMDLLAPVDSDVRGFPYTPDHDFGPSGLSFANDRWQLRPAIKIRMTPKDPQHPYSRKDLYLDRETLRALYSFAYDATGALWKVIVHNGRFSESDPDYYLGWRGVPTPRDAKTVADVVLNVQTGLGTRIEYWDNHGTPIGGRSEIETYLKQRMTEQGI
jgi:hypothetical protein